MGRKNSSHEPKPNSQEKINHVPQVGYEMKEFISDIYIHNTCIGLNKLVLFITGWNLLALMQTD